MSFFYKFLAILLVAGLIFYIQPSDRQDAIKGWLKDKSYSIIERTVSEEPVEGEIVGEGGSFDVIFYGKPNKEFDCHSDFDCEYVPACYLKDCECDSNTGQCFSRL